jgi:competence protein ComFC
MRLLEHLFDAIAPYDCLACGCEGTLLCANCATTALPVLERTCYGCQTPDRFARTCPDCRLEHAIEHVWFGTEYTGVAKRLVHELKFAYAAPAAQRTAECLADCLPGLRPGTIVTHVPTVTAHVRERGFDHAARIAHETARLLGLRHLPLLGRQGQARQVGAGRRERLMQLEGAFRVLRPHIVQDASILLIDDVYTTGTTLETAAEVLCAAGAAHVDAAVFARSPSRKPLEMV